MTKPAGDETTPEPARVLFLDDDPGRAGAFLAGCPEAVWVSTVGECIEMLEAAEGWDEVHLDHDLGGETFVQSHRDDCGMEVVRWLCRDGPRPHLRATRFVVHSWNPDAAFAMTMQLDLAGYHAVARPFGVTRDEDGSALGGQGLSSRAPLDGTWAAWAGRILGRLAPGRRPADDEHDAGSTADPRDEKESGH
ncbi:cyclic-phosphate processing receiver domain-containing protein [Isosphaeraceae bacterium EP7]